MGMATQTYLKYMKEVLGVNHIPMETLMETETPKAIGEAEQINSLQALFIDQKKWSVAAMDLFQKMREAMKLSPEQIEILFAENLSNSELQIKALTAKEIVCFNSELFENLKAHYPHNLTQTVGPMELLKTPALKKQTWGDLQQVMKKLSIA